MIHMRILIISIVSVITSTICMMLFNVNSITGMPVYHMLYGAVTALIGMMYGVKSEYSFIERHNIKDVLSLCISCFVGALSIITISAVLKLMSRHAIISSIFMIVLIVYTFDSIVSTALSIHYPSDTNSNFIDDEDIDD